MHSQELAKYIIINGNTTVEDEISEQNFFSTVKDAENWIKENEPKGHWDIFYVDISHVDEVSFN